ncbi:MAG: phenazine biosynthesis protein PhzF [Acidobacteriales bacterium]|nr:phenazine biosynthesis protein PhzF [Terriglobales bacterium]
MIDPPSTLRFQTVDVFTDRRFGGNPLAVFEDAEELSDREMQAWAFELNLSETTFVLPPSDLNNTARVRIFNRTAEMAFAGHPLIGTAYVLARKGLHKSGSLKLEVMAGVVPVEMQVDGKGEFIGASITAPKALSLGDFVPLETVAKCMGLDISDVDVSKHLPIVASMGTAYVIAQVSEDALARCNPDVREFRKALQSRHDLNDFCIHLYSRSRSDRLRARMFAPLAGTVEDPATGSANAPLAGLLLSLNHQENAYFRIDQGVEMGRPSVLLVTATRTGGEIHATITGRCVPVLQGVAQTAFE